MVMFATVITSNSFTNNFFLLFFKNISDEELPFLTPYDVFLNERDTDQDQSSPYKSTTQNAAVQVSPKMQPKITEKNISYDISDEKLLTAAAQLVDVYNKRSKASATITMQKRSVSDSRNRNLNISKPAVRSSFGIPNFIVTKITEKTADKNISGRNAKQMHGLNIVKTIHKQEEIEQTKRMVELQRQESLHIFNTTKKTDDLQKKNQKKIVNAKEFRVKSLNISHKNAGHLNISDQKKRSTSKSEVSMPVKNEPIILNFRTKVRDTTTSPRNTETKTLNGRNNVNTYRVLGISPLSKKADERRIAQTSDRHLTNKLHSSSIGKSVSTLAMPVTKVYSRFPSNSTRTLHQNRTLMINRASILKKCPSMPNLSSIDKLQNNFLCQRASHDLDSTKASTNLTRYKSCFIFGTKLSANLFEQTIKNNEEYSKLYNLCANVVSKLCFKGQVMRRKRGRPKKKVYNSITRDLLNSPEFSLKADILKLNERHYDSKMAGQAARRSKRFALLSIEPVLPDRIFSKSRDRSPVRSFQINRMPLKTYSRANLIQPRILDHKRNETPSYKSKPQIQLLNIEPMSSTSQNDLQKNINEEVSQSTEYIIDAVHSIEDIDESDAVYIEYLEENDEIESPAYEPHVSVSDFDARSGGSITTEEADTTVENCSQHLTAPDQYMTKTPLHIIHHFSNDAKKTTHIEIKYVKTSESDAHSTTDSIAEVFTVCQDDDKPQFIHARISPQIKTDINISPVRKSTRKRKIPLEFPNFAKKVRS